MDIRQITPDYSVAPQIAAGDAAALRRAGFRHVICNRPDAEVESELGSAAIRQAVESEGLTFHVNPVTNGAMTEDNIAAQGDVLAVADGPVLAYCRSGTRCTVVWALSQAGTRPADTLIAEAAAAGYDIAGLRGQIEAFAAREG